MLNFVGYICVFEALISILQGKLHQSCYIYAYAYVGVSYVVTRFATTLESLWVYYMITDKSASARIPL
jgi:hypothetical protein